MWSKDTNQGQLKMLNSVGLTNLQEIVVTWIEEYEYKYIYMSGYEII